MIFEHLDRIVFLGDSVTDAGSVCPIGEGLGNNAGFGYVRMVDNFLAATYPERSIRVTNAGISGDTSRKLLMRFDRDCIDLDPAWVSICVGINDIRLQFSAPTFTEQAVLPDEYESNLNTMIEKCKRKSTVKGIFLLTPFYVEPNREDALRAQVDAYVAICRRLAKKHGCILVDFQALYDDYCKFHHSSFIADDRIHPNQIGATLMAKELLRHCDFDFTK